VSDITDIKRFLGYLFLTFAVLIRCAMSASISASNQISLSGCGHPDDLLSRFASGCRSGVARFALSGLIAAESLMALPRDAKAQTIMEQCSNQWSSLKASGKVDGRTWPEFLHDCRVDLQSGNTQPSAPASQAYDDAAGFCGWYASTALNQVLAAQTVGTCRHFVGEFPQRWSSNYKGHYNYCMSLVIQNRKDAPEQEYRIRADALNQCINEQGSAASFAQIQPAPSPPSLGRVQPPPAPPPNTQVDAAPSPGTSKLSKAECMALIAQIQFRQQFPINRLRDLAEQQIPPIREAFAENNCEQYELTAP
jgi:hypothetical protein